MIKIRGQPYVLSPAKRFRQFDEALILSYTLSTYGNLKFSIIIFKRRDYLFTKRLLKVLFRNKLNMT